MREIELEYEREGEWECEREREIERVTERVTIWAVPDILFHLYKNNLVQNPAHPVYRVTTRISQAREWRLLGSRSNSRHRQTWPLLCSIAPNKIRQTTSIVVLLNARMVELIRCLLFPTSSARDARETWSVFVFVLSLSYGNNNLSRVVLGPLGKYWTLDMNKIMHKRTQLPVCSVADYHLASVVPSISFRNMRHWMLSKARSGLP